jgi:hypothetical protein
MNAGDASTLRQVSLAALVGLDARPLLGTDEPAIHVVYDKLIEQGIKLWLHRNEVHQHNQAVAIVAQLAQTFGRKK